MCEFCFAVKDPTLTFYVCESCEKEFDEDEL